MSHHKSKLITVSGFYDETGVDRRTVIKYIREAGLKPVKVQGKAEYFDRGEMLRITEKLLKPKDPAQSTLKDQKTLEEIRKLRIANDTKEKLVVLKTTIATRDAKLAENFKSILYSKIVDEAPADMTNDVATNRALLQRHADLLLTEVASWQKEFANL